MISKMFPPGIGGAETYAYELANALGKRGHTVDVYTQFSNQGDAEVAVHSNVDVNRITRARKQLVVLETVYFSLRSRFEIDFSNYDIVHGTLMPASTIALTPGLAMDDIPIVLTSHGIPIDASLATEAYSLGDYLMKYIFHPINSVLDKIAGHSASAIIAISRHTEIRLKEVYNFGDSKIEYIPHGVNTEMYTPDAGQYDRVLEDRFNVLYVGRLSPRKGIDLVIRAVAEMDIETELFISGIGRHESRLRKLASSLGIEDKVTFLGYVPNTELRALYASVDVLTLPSTYDSFGLVLLEAMASGTPVIGTKVGGITDVIDDGINGYLIPRDPSILASRLERLGTDRTLRQMMASNARRHAEAMSWEKVADQVESVYTSVLESSTYEY